MMKFTEDCSCSRKGDTLLRQSMMLTEFTDAHIRHHSLNLNEITLYIIVVFVKCIDIIITFQISSD